MNNFFKINIFFKDFYKFIFQIMMNNLNKIITYIHYTIKFYKY